MAVCALACCVRDDGRGIDVARRTLALIHRDGRLYLGQLQVDDGRDIDVDRRPMALDRRDGRLRLGHLLRERAPAVCGW